MSTDLTATPTWPAEPVTTSGVRDRLSWYASVARWAPSKHNAQPWRFAVVDGALEFWDVPERALHETDPRGRERLISQGAAVHLACLAARAHGYDPQVSLFPDGAGDLVARLTERARREVADEDRTLLSAIPRRRTDRGPLDAGPLPRGLPFLLQSAASEHGATLRLVSTPGERTTLADLVERADRLLVTRERADEELAPWLRDADDLRPDGVPAENTRGAAASYRAAFVQRDFSTSRSRPAQDRPGPDQPVVGVLCTPGDQVTDWVAAGRALAAVLLRATVAGANASYLNQPLEVPALRAQLREQLALPGFGQLVLRIGVGGDVAPTPRRSLDDVLVLA